MFVHSVPEDVSITVFDDIVLAGIVSPERTAVHVPHREMGRKIAQVLIHMVEGRFVDLTTKLDLSLKLRKSHSNSQ